MFYKNALENALDEISNLEITDTFIACMTIDEMTSGPVQLLNEEEARKLIKEFEDIDGELCYGEESVMGLYPAFHPLRP